MKKTFKRFLYASLIILGVVAVTLTTCYKMVEMTAKDSIYQHADDIPYNKVGWLLGTNPVGPTGHANLYFTYRIDATVQLYRAGKISYVLVSGDNHSKEYDEPMAMKEALMQQGIPDSVIVLDYAGFRTLDSIIRAKEIFGQSAFTIISQHFHNERAIALAKHYGISAIGYDAKDVARRATSVKVSILRESLARVKMYLDFLFHKQPKFLGDPIEIK